MSSYALEDFVGNGVLRDLTESLMADGWDDVPTLKMMSAQDMETLQLSQLQRDALEIRSYLHDKNLMQYADALEASGKTLSDFLQTRAADLTAEYHMKAGHVARFLDRGSACAIRLPRNLTLPARKGTAEHHGVPLEGGKEEEEEAYSKASAKDESKPVRKDPSEMDFSSELELTYPGMKVVTNANGTSSIDVSGFREPLVLRPIGGQAPASKGTYSAAKVEPRLCGLVKHGGPKGAGEVTPLAVLEKIMIQKLMPAYTKGNRPFKSGPLNLPPLSKACELWAKKATLILCLRRPGCVMCRAEAHQLYARKPIFDAMGIQLVVCLNEYIEAEVRAFWPRYWGGIVAVDPTREFFKALGGGELNKEWFVPGFLFNSVARANRKRAVASGVRGNSKGETNIKGGLYILRPGTGGVLYQFVERNFGDWAPLEEVLDACSNIQG